MGVDWRNLGHNCGMAGVRRPVAVQCAKWAKCEEDPIGEDGEADVLGIAKMSVRARCLARNTPSAMRGMYIMELLDGTIESLDQNGISYMTV